MGAEVICSSCFFVQGVEFGARYKRDLIAKEVTGVFEVMGERGVEVH